MKIPGFRKTFGAEIQYFRLDPRVWELMIDHLVDTGLERVTTYIQWATHLAGEPDAKNPAGVLDFDGRTDPRRNLRLFLDLVVKRGLRMNFRCGPFCCNEAVHGGYPAWLVLGDPSIMVWDWQNRTTQGYWIARREGSQPSYLHPVYLDWTAKWFAALAPIIREYSVQNGGCIDMINLDNEVSYITQDGFLSSDYNPVNVRPGGFYHLFLQEKYGTIAGVPYPAKPACLEDIVPPRAVPETIGEDFAYYADWAEFKTWAMARYIAELKRMHQANGVTGVTFMTNLNPHRPEGVPVRMPAFEKAIDGLVGYDFYRGSFLSYSGYHSMARVLKLMNASLAYTWSAEFMSGIWSKDFTTGSRVSDDHMTFMARCALAHGCKAISWFMFHDRDTWGDSPVSSLGHRRPSWNVLHDTFGLLREKVPYWDELRPQTDCAILYSLAAQTHTTIGDPAPCADNDLHIGKPAIDGVEAGKYSAEYEGLFRLVEQAGYQAAAIDPLARPHAVFDHRVILLPGTPVLERRTRDLLETFAAKGGKLLVTGKLPSRDENGRPLDWLPAGHFTHAPDWIAQEAAENEKLASIAFVRELIQAVSGAPTVQAEPETMPAAWVNWAQGGGTKKHEQPRNLSSAVLHTAQGHASLLFLLNHYIDAFYFVVRFGATKPRQLICVDSAEEFPARADGTFLVPVDRKSGRIFRVVE